MSSESHVSTELERKKEGREEGGKEGRKEGREEGEVGSFFQCFPIIELGII